jgi:hypothetical protein
MQNLKFKYIFQHEETGRIMSMIFTMGEIEEDGFRDRWPKRYNLVTRLRFTGLHDETRWDELTAGEKLYFVNVQRKENNMVNMDNAGGLWKGREIYEGDFLKCKQYIDGNQVDFCSENGCAEYKDAAFYLKREQGLFRPICWFVEYDYKFKIIGNAFQNSELLCAPPKQS